MKLDPSLSPYPKVNSRWIRDLNVRTQTIRIAEENLGDIILDTGVGKGFMTKSSKTITTKAKIDKWGSFAGFLSSNIGLISLICKELKQLNKTKTTPLNSRQKT